MEREPQKIARQLGLPQPRVLELLRHHQSLIYHYLRFTYPFPDDCSVMGSFVFIVTLSRNGWVIFTQNPLARRRLLRCDGVFNVHNRAQDYPAILERCCPFRLTYNFLHNIMQNLFCTLPSKSTLTINSQMITSQHVGNCIMNSCIWRSCVT